MEETIAAIATAIGESGIGIIRISGENSKAVLERIFRPASSKIESRKMMYGHIVDPVDSSIIDEVLCVYMKAPKTYTTEDVVEINCHGGIVPLRRILDLVISNGARLAEAGEFTKRAFLNGRLDLSQAEAVIDLIKARTDKSFDVAMDQLDGKFSGKITDMRNRLVDVLVNITVNIDYPDEDIEEIVYDKLINDLEEIALDIDKLLDSAQVGKIIKEGLKVSIVGKPNVGKSSLMNCLLQESRAIVTDIPGTTRDTIEEAVNISGIPVVLTDTAGIRATDDEIERIGIEKSKKAFNDADLVILMLDSGRYLDEEDMEIIKYISGDRTLVILNKTDLNRKMSMEEFKNVTGEAVIIEASMTEEKGIDDIKNAIVEKVYGGSVSNNSLLVTNARHKALLENSKNSLSDAITMLKNGEALEFIEIDVNSCYASLGEIIGETVKDDIIDAVFERFCLGK